MKSCRGEHWRGQLTTGRRVFLLFRSAPTKLDIAQEGLGTGTEKASLGHSRTNIARFRPELPSSRLATIKIAGGKMPPTTTNSDAHQAISRPRGRRLGIPHPPTQEPRLSRLSPRRIRPISLLVRVPVESRTDSTDRWQEAGSDNFPLMIFILGIVSGSDGMRSELDGFRRNRNRPGSPEAQSYKPAPQGGRRDHEEDEIPQFPGNRLRNLHAAAGDASHAARPVRRHASFALARRQACTNRNGQRRGCRCGGAWRSGPRAIASFPRGPSQPGMGRFHVQLAHST